MKYLAYPLILLAFGGCVSTKVEVDDNKAISTEKVKHQGIMNFLDEAYEVEDASLEKEHELYFADTKGKILYASGDKDSIEVRMDILLDSAFSKSKSRLPKLGRHEKLNISLEVARYSDYRKELVNAAQSYILSNRKYALVSTDDEALQALKRVLQKEKDDIYVGGDSIKTKSKSDVIVFLKAIKSGDDLELSTKLIAKNGSIIGLASTQVDLNPDRSATWVSVSVPRNDGPDQQYEVMRLPVSDKEYHGTTMETPVKDVSFIAANEFCVNKMQGQLMAPYVFENARKNLLMARPTSPVDVEMMAPYDEEDDSIYINDGDNLEASDGTIITFHWNNEKYFSVSNLFRSRNATFRCMRVK